MSSDIREQVKLLEKSVHGKDYRYTLRVLRCLANTRRKLNSNVLRRLVNGYFTHSAKDREALNAFIFDEVRKNIIVFILILCLIVKI